LGLSQYGDALKLAREKQPRLQRGLIGRAKKDLEESLDAWPELKDASHVKKALESLQDR
jgi:hypothetical protein